MEEENKTEIKEQTECKSECSITSPQRVLDNTISEILATDDKHIMENQELPYGWKKDENGRLIYHFLPCDIQEMKKSRLKLLISVLFNIFSALFMIIHFCSHH